VPWPRTENVRLARAISCLYQAQIVEATPEPRNTIGVRFEDFVLGQEATLGRLEEFLGFPLARIPVNPEPVGRWLREDRPQSIPHFLRQELPRLGYDDEADVRYAALARV
jgi:hypothetical protein